MARKNKKYSFIKSVKSGKKTTKRIVENNKIIKSLQDT
jgi:hypothetical protein